MVEQERQLAENALHDSEAASRLIIDRIPGIVLFMTPAGELEFVNQLVIAYFGKTLEQLKHWWTDDTVHPEDRAGALDIFTRATASGEPYRFEARFRRSDGVYRWFQCRGVPHRDEAGRIVRWYAVGSDIEDRKRTEVLLAGEKQLLEMVASDQQTSSILETLCRHVEGTASGSYCSIVLVDPTGTKLEQAIAPSLPTEFNDAVRGWPLERIGGPCQVAARDKTPVIMSDVASDTRWRNSWRSLAQKHGLRSCWSTPMLSQAGNVMGTFALYQREPGTPTPFLLDVIRQYTHIASIAIERSQRDAALRQSEARRAAAERDLQLMIDTIPVFVAAYEPDGTRSFVNQTWQDYMGLTAAEATGPNGKRTFPHFHPVDAERIDGAWRASLASGQPLATEARVRRADGQYRWHTSHRVPLRDEEGRIVRWYSVGIDINDKKVAEDALRRSEARLAAAERELQLTVDTIPSLVATYRPDGSRLFVNRTWLDYTGLSPESAINAERGDIVHPDDAARTAREWKDCLATGAAFKAEVRLRRADGEYRWHSVHRLLARDETGAMAKWYSVGVDIEEQKRAEEKLRQSEHNSRLIVDSIPGLIAIFTPEGKFEGVNRQMIAYFGKTVDDIRSKRWSTREAIHPEDYARCTELFKQSVASGDPFEFEIRFRRADGIYRWFQSRGLPLRDSSGRIVRWYNLLTDIDERKRAEEKAVEAERDLQLALNTIPNLITAYAPDGSRTFVNRSFLDYRGLSLEQALALGRGDIIHPDDFQRAEEEFNICQATGTPSKAEFRLRRADGEYRWHAVHRVFARNDRGEIVRWYHSAVDIDDRKRAEESLRQSEARLAEAQRELQLTIDSIPVMVAAYDPDGTRRFVNRQWQEFTHRDSEEATGPGQRLMRQFHPDEAETVERAFWDSLETGEPLTLDVRIKRGDGDYRWHTHQSVPLRDARGKVVKWYAIDIDIEDRKRAESALQHSETRLGEAERELRVTLDSIPTITWRAGANGYVQQLNQRWFEYTGTTHEQVRGWRWKLCVHPDDLDQLVANGAHYVSSGEPIDSEARLRRHDGEYRWFLFRPAPARDESGKIVGWYGTITDIEDRKRAEQKALEAEREVQHMLDSIPAMIVRGGTNGYIQYFSKQWFEYTGTTLETARGFRWWESLHPDDKDRLVEFGARFVASAEPGGCEARLRRFDGTYRWFLFRPAPALDRAGNFVGWYGTVTDIEDQRRAEAELRRSETILAEGQRISSTGSFSWRVDTNELVFSDELLRIFEFDLTGPLTFDRVFSRIHPEDRQALSERMKRIRSGGAAGEQEVRLQMEDGRIKYLRSVGHMMRSPDGRTEYLGAIQDISQRQLAEEATNRVRSELAHVTRVMSLGALTASIAHEVNQPLAGIITNASTCLRMLAADPPNVEGARETARRTIRDGNRAADVITRLRALFGKKATATETVDLNEATREVVALVFSDLLRNRVIVRVELDDEPLVVTGDRVQLQQVILNLVRNASDAMSEVNDRPRNLLVKAERQQDGSTRLTVRDAGVGLHPQTAERLFDAFYTSKNDGMGIGLSVSRSIIESHGGRIWAEANDGPGATFSFSIPQQVTNAGDEGAVGAILTRPTRGAHDQTRNA